jgi:hypothetical protein
MIPLAVNPFLMKTSLQMHSSEVAMAMDYITTMRLTSIEIPPTINSLAIGIS